MQGQERGLSSITSFQLACICKDPISKCHMYRYWELDLNVFGESTVQLTTETNTHHEKTICVKVVSLAVSNLWGARNMLCGGKFHLLHSVLPFIPLWLMGLIPCKISSLYFAWNLFIPRVYTLVHPAHRGFPGDSDGKESSCNAGDPGSIPGLRRSPEEGNGYPLRYTRLGNPMDRRAWRATVHGIANSQTQLRD